MNRLRIEITEFHVEPTFDELAASLAKMGSDDFGKLMGKFEEYLESGCGDRAKVEMQECWIASQLPDNAARFFRSVVEFLDMQDKEKVPT